MVVHSMPSLALLSEHRTYQQKPSIRYGTERVLCSVLDSEWESSSLEPNCPASKKKLGRLGSRLGNKLKHGRLHSDFLAVFIFLK